VDKTCARRSLRHYNLRLGKLPKAQKKSASDALAILREMQQAAVGKCRKMLKALLRNVT
jgi:hypothetical protein